MATFDLASFLTTVYEAPFQTKRALVPEGTYFAVIESFTVEIGKRPGSLNCRFVIELDEPELRTELNRDKVTMQPMIFLDADPEDLSILLYGTNENIVLGQIRKALGQNDPTEPWNFGQLEGGRLMVKVAHKPQKDPETKQPTGEIFDQVVAWLPITD